MFFHSPVYSYTYIFAIIFTVGPIASRTELIEGLQKYVDHIVFILFYEAAVGTSTRGDEI